MFYLQVSFPSSFYSKAAFHGIKRVHSKSILWGRGWRCLCDDPYCGTCSNISFPSTFSRNQEQSLGFVSCKTSNLLVTLTYKLMNLFQPVTVYFVLHVLWEVLWHGGYSTDGPDSNLARVIMPCCMTNKE